ncbi:MAG TPA: DUF5723 family protein [Candidatus Cloacimonadota bacterium]|nr:DUF5723 family protein [Candidatus Cloacimonadota bacterium]
MRKLILVLTVLSLTLSISAMPSAKSIFFADSYMLRATGVEANYWNPARLQKGERTEYWLPGVNSAVAISNNALDLDTYNYFVSRDTLFSADKERLLRDVKGKLAVNGEASISIYGYTMSNAALSISSRVFAKAKAQEDILRLALYGNTEDHYRFTRNSNNVSGMAYTDVTYGIGGYNLPFMPAGTPLIKVGGSLSALIGMANLETNQFLAEISTDAEGGVNARQNTIIRSSTYGFGFKGMLSMYSQIMPQWEAGLSLDNIGGNILWRGSNEERHFSLAIDSVFVASIDDDIYTLEEETIEIDPYGTSLPMELRLASKYDLGPVDVSADWVQGFKESAVTSDTGRLSMAAEAHPWSFMPVSFGLSFPNSKIPLKASYSIGLRSRVSEFGIAVQSYNSIFPGYKSKGVSLATSLRLRF